MNKRIIISLYKKEMLDVIRDKKTIIVMIVVPLIIYPLLFIFGIQFISGITKDISTSTYTIAFKQAVDEDLIELFAQNDDTDYSFDIVKVNDYEEALCSEQIDAYIELSDDEGMPEYIIHYLSSVNSSSYSADYCAEIIKKYSKKLTVSLIESNGLNAQDILEPVKVEYRDMASNEESAGNLLGTILPYMLIISLLLGTAYPAIDATAGERERGTLETVLTLPITNRQLIVSKFLAVSTLGIITAILNVISMGFVCVYMIKMMGTLGVDLSVDMAKFIPAILVGILCIVAFAIFMSAVTMCVCAFAKTYKEANNYITPITLVVMFASFVAFIPGIELTERMALVPVANICLLIKNILVFKFNIGIIAIVLISNVAYGIVAVMLLGKIYNSESVLFGDGSGATQIFEKRSNLIAGGVPSYGDAWLIISITAVFVIYAGGSAQLNYGIFGVLLTQLIIAGIPFLAALYTKKSLRKTFKLNPCRLTCIVPSIIIIIGAIMLGMVLTSLTSMLFKGSAENVTVSMDSLIGDTFIVTLLVVAVVPAICEELMFRGYILSALETKLKPAYAILAAAAFFGIYHMSIVKFFTTGLLGIFICYVAHRTKSIIPGMVMHFINNGISCVYMYYPDKIEKYLPVIAKEQLSASDLLLLLAMGILVSFIGIKMLKFVTGEEKAPM